MQIDKLGMMQREVCRDRKNENDSVQVDMHKSI